MSFYKDCREEQKRFYASKKWRKCRDAYLSEHPVCERCLLVGRANPAEIVHHKEELNQDNYKDPFISLNPDNLEALCLDCHNKEHFKAAEVDEELYFDADGNLKQREPTHQGGIT